MRKQLKPCPMSDISPPPCHHQWKRNYPKNEPNWTGNQSKTCWIWHHRPNLFPCHLPPHSHALNTMTSLKPLSPSLRLQLPLLESLFPSLHHSSSSCIPSRFSLKCYPLGVSFSWLPHANRSPTMPNVLFHHWVYFLLAFITAYNCLSWLTSTRL